jgi:AcrR family transcriptional regulator
VRPVAERERQPKMTGSRRAEILAAARELFMTRGYRAVSTRDIADAVGLTQPALYHHFGGKEALYVAVLEDELHSRSEEMWQAVRAHGPATSRLATVAARIAERSEHDLTQMFHDLRFEISETNRSRIGAAFREAMMAPLLALVGDLERDGLVEGSTAGGLGSTEVVMYILSVIRMLTEAGAGPARGPARTPEEIGELTVRLVTSGIGPRRTR